MVFEREHGPLGPERGDYQAALVAYTIAVLGGAKNPRFEDFLLRWGQRRPRQSAAEQLSIFRALASQFEEKARVDNR